MNKAIISYDKSNNLGDYIQSISAKKLIGNNSILIDRDSLKNYFDKKVQLIVNGWFMENSGNWPPSNFIHPLFISFHINPIAKNKILSKEGVNYLKKYEPIGCRDIYTKKLLKTHNIDAYFSGCLTLTLNKADFIDNKNRNDILVISVFERLIPIIKCGKINYNNIINIIKYPFRYFKYLTANKRLKKKLDNLKSVKFTSQILNKKFSIKEKYVLAEEQLKDIANSKLVITSRIHSALPAVAFGIPVLFLNDGLDHINHKSRIKGLDNYFYSINSNKLKSINITNIKNKNNHIINRNTMIKKIKSFIK